MIFILFLFTSLPTLQKWSGKDPGNYKSIKGRLRECNTVQYSYYWLTLWSPTQHCCYTLNKGRNSIMEQNLTEYSFCCLTPESPAHQFCLNSINRNKIEECNPTRVFVLLVNSFNHQHNNVAPKIDRHRRCSVQDLRVNLWVMSNRV